MMRLLDLILIYLLSKTFHHLTTNLGSHVTWYGSKKICELC